MSIAVQTVPTPEDLASTAANIFASQIQDYPDSVLGLATGSTPVDTYARLADLYENGLSFEHVTTFNLDEYVGLSQGDPQSYHSFMTTHLFDQVDLDPSRTHLPDGDSEDLDEACEEYERLLQDAGGIDLQLLGIGSNGHIAFNEPGCADDSLTRVVDLAPETVAANSRFFDSEDDVPGQAITAGIATILSADKILLLAYGENKAEAVCQALAGEITSDCPASFLQKHPDCTFLLDAKAAELLTEQ
ncbi:TPA: glucosamine-6-phosphate deaminase [Candidatus Latescibacteria bacterium]|nr:glucosamine-6-phosphate deaminase [Candidatus Latescibacterota bacterium]